jgi:hypothetical protein
VSAQFFFFGFSVWTNSPLLRFLSHKMLLIL